MRSSPGRRKADGPTQGLRRPPRKFRDCGYLENRLPRSVSPAAQRSFTQASHTGSSAMAPAAMLLHPRRELLALCGCEYLRRVAKSSHDAARRLLGELEMLGAQRLDRGPVDAVLREQLERLPARLAYPLAKRQQVFRRLLNDRRELLLLLLGGVDLDVEVLGHAIEVLVHLSGIEWAGRKAAVVPTADTTLFDVIHAELLCSSD